MNPAKVADLIKVPFGVVSGWAQGIVLDGVQFPHWYGNFFHGRHVPDYWKSLGLDE